MPLIYRGLMIKSAANLFRNLVAVSQSRSALRWPPLPPFGLGLLALGQSPRVEHHAYWPTRLSSTANQSRLCGGLSFAGLLAGRVLTLGAGSFICLFRHRGCHHHPRISAPLGVAASSGASVNTISFISQIFLLSEQTNKSQRWFIAVLHALRCCMPDMNCSIHHASHQRIHGPSPPASR